ncbi:uncharacterized protein MELLADRAFT_58793 [Melampsora larici-populina 98AG31]|uniref:Uncharacterized protein n=1 Tax=Melampsora larici-populina (strain 98AG31 / pathotype 3-4-7) TaxID=747676 RepID=F4R4V9_MELLP|nr:uncharacterized protein MELLADRAFT_58793 [Melampsora larici-populina 98AG31]EGG12930.1 hypothetical protein MELLADRAFT_58793 [Melampsora larici-populina 98AG31]
MSLAYPAPISPIESRYHQSTFDPHSLPATRPKLSSVSLTSSRAPPIRSYKELFNTVTAKGGTMGSSRSECRNYTIPLDRSNQPTQAEVQYRLIKSSRRLVGGKMIYEETEAVQRFTYPARSNKRAVRFASSPTSSVFEIPSSREDSSMTNDYEGYHDGSYKNTNHREPSTPTALMSGTNRGRTRHDSLPRISQPQYSSHARPSPLPFRPHPDELYADVCLPSTVSGNLTSSYERHRNQSDATQCPSSQRELQRKLSTSGIDHSDHMRTEAERLSSCLLRRPAPPPMPQRPTTEFFLFSTTGSLPGFMILRQLGRINSRVLPEKIAQECIRKECESDERMSSTNAVIWFRSEIIEGTIPKKVRNLEPLPKFNYLFNPSRSGVVISHLSSRYTDTQFLEMRFNIEQGYQDSKALSFRSAYSKTSGCCYVTLVKVRDESDPQSFVSRVKLADKV